MTSGSKQNIHFNRIYLIVIGLLLFWVVLEVKLFDIQINHHEFYVEQSQIQSAKKIVLPARRGTIYDRNNERLATNLIHYDLGVDLRRVKNRKKIANALSPIFGKSADYYTRKMKKNRDFVYLERKVKESLIESLNSLDDPGLVKVKGYKRFYPYGKYGSQLIGFTNIDDKGIAGLELQYENLLNGNAGWTFLMADAHRRFGYHVDFPQVLPESGHDLTLTIDKNIQTIVDDEIAKSVKKYNAKFGIAVLMNPNTGEVLAMSSYPGFDLNNPGSSTTGQRRNRAITDIFEPGSTFKVFPAAALLQENLKKPNDIIFCENGSYRLYDHTVHDSKSYGWLSFKRVIENSSNIGMVKLTADISNRIFYRYLKNFGFDAQTGINLIGEESGILLKPDKFSGISKGVISFGQEIGVTAIQIVSGFCAVVNGGKLMQPYVINRITAADGKIIQKSKPRIIRQVLSESVSDILKEFMVDAVRRGTGKKIKIDKTLMGGKTGTAQKFNRKTKRYERNAFLSSFIGFAPAKSPRYVLGVFLDEPKPRYYGGDVAAPIFSSIMHRLIDFTPTDQVYPQTEIKIAVKSTAIPDFSGLSYTTAEEYFEINNISYNIKGDGTHILTQKKDSDDIQLILGNPKVRNPKVPDFRGKTIREALKLVDFELFKVKINGRGVVTKQNPHPGSSVIKRQALLLTCTEPS